MLYFNKEVIWGRGAQLLLYLSGVQILDKEVFIMVIIQTVQTNLL